MLRRGYCHERISGFHTRTDARRGRIEIYWSEIRSTFVGHEVKLPASYGAQEDPEGPATEGTVIAEFPSMEAAKRWYDSPAYKKVHIHRQKGAVYRGILVQGL
jgi:uncharacterized protein (DUF1330 family)